MAMIGGRNVKYARFQRSKTTIQNKLWDYVKRDATLPECGYGSYQEYLKSDEWKDIRAKRLRHHPGCLTCHKPACQVHHTNYSIHALMGLSNGSLVTLCDDCHRGIEFDGNRKRTLAEANKELCRRAAANGQHAWLRMMARQRKRLSNQNALPTLDEGCARLAKEKKRKDRAANKDRQARNQVGVAKAVNPNRAIRTRKSKDTFRNLCRICRQARHAPQDVTKVCIGCKFKQHPGTGVVVVV